MNGIERAPFRDVRARLQTDVAGVDGNREFWLRVTSFARASFKFLYKIKRVRVRRFFRSEEPVFIFARATFREIIIAWFYETRGNY